MMVDASRSRLTLSSTAMSRKTISASSVAQGTPLPTTSASRSRLTLSSTAMSRKTISASSVAQGTPLPTTSASRSRLTLLKFQIAIKFLQTTCVLNVIMVKYLISMIKLSLQAANCLPNVVRFQRDIVIGVLTIYIKTMNGLTALNLILKVN